MLSQKNNSYKRTAIKSARYAPLILVTLLQGKLAFADLSEAEKAFQQRDYSTALKQADDLLQNQPANFDASFLKAQILTSMKQPDAAISLYESLIQQSPERPEPYNNLAMLYAQKGDLETARQLLEKAIKTHASYATVYDNLSKVYVEMARDSYGKALKLNLAKQSVALKGLNTAPVVVAASNVESAQTMQVAQAEIKQATQPETTITTSEPESDEVLQPRSSKPVEQQAVVINTPVQNKPVTKVQTVDKPASKPVPAVIDKEEVVTTMQGWAAAWSAQQVDLYLSFYDEQYHPVGVSRQQWLQQRRVRLKKPQWVQVTLNDIEVSDSRNDQVVVKLIQRYRSSGYQDKTKKQFLLKKTMDGWRILSESSLALFK